MAYLRYWTRGDACIAPYQHICEQRGFAGDCQIPSVNNVDQTLKQDVQERTNRLLSFGTSRNALKKTSPTILLL
jgi:hypothetical protein